MNLRAGRFYDTLYLYQKPPINEENEMKNKYYFGDIYKLEDDLFYSYETMIEYARENWADYARPVGDDATLIVIQNIGATLIFNYSVRNEYGTLETATHTSSLETVQMTWLVSELEQMIARV
jgi:hypothetical protein